MFGQNNSQYVSMVVGNKDMEKIRDRAGSGMFFYERKTVRPDDDKTL